MLNNADAQSDMRIRQSQPPKGIVMRIFAITVLALLTLWSTESTVRAQQSSDCKDCRDQQRACMANYSAKTCKSEYDICMKACRRK